MRSHMREQQKAGYRGRHALSSRIRAADGNMSGKSSLGLVSKFVRERRFP